MIEWLIYKLERAGIVGNLLNWFRSYLHNRRQCVVLNGTKSDIKYINAGVPQGSILGPLLFILYINDIVDEVSTNIRLYADDSCIFTVGHDSQTMANELNSNLERISAWARKWKVNFNAKKTINMTFARRHPDHIIPLYLDGTRIKDTTRHKHLGCILQSNCKWSAQVNDIETRCNKKIDILRGLRHKLDRNT